MRIFGLIGKSIEHSFSPGFFTDKFIKENQPDFQYKLFPLKNIEEVVQLCIANTEIQGLNVTIPYKKAVIPFLNEIDPVALEIGAVNTIKIVRDQKQIRLLGFNTDAYGFEHSCSALHRQTKALVLGTGGVALAVTFVLKQLQIPFFSVSRFPKGKFETGYNNLNDSIMQDHQIIINTTPLGMYPDVGECPPIPYKYLNSKHFLFDMIYNPAETKFLKLGRLEGATTQNGKLMLELQAERSWEIWN